MPTRVADRDSSYVSQAAQRRSRPRQERWLRLVRTQRQRRTKCQPADERHRQELTRGKNPIQFVQVGGDHPQSRLTLSEVVESALEGRDLFAGTASPFGKQNQRIVTPHGIKHVLDRLLRIIEGRRNFLTSMATRHQYRPENIYRNRSAKSFVPVILGRYRPGSRANLCRQRRPQHYKIQMAAVIGEINGLPRIWFGIHPTHVHSTDQSCHPRDDSRQWMRRHRFFRSATIRAVRRTQVTIIPITIRVSARAIVFPFYLKESSTTERTHAAVSNAI